MIRRHEQGGYTNSPETSACRRGLGDDGDRRLGGRVGDHRATDRHRPGGQLRRPPAAGSAAPDVAAFCDAEVAAELPRSQSEDPEADRSGVRGARRERARRTSAEPSKQSSPTPSPVPGDPAFDEAYGGDDRLHARELRVCRAQRRPSPSTRSEGFPKRCPPDRPSSPPKHIGEEVHEMIIVRINDDVTLSVEELLALPEEEADTMVTFLGGVFGVFPGTSQSTRLGPHARSLRGRLLLPPGLHARGVRADDGCRGGCRRVDPRRLGTVPTRPARTAPAGTEHAEMATDTATPRARRPSRARHRQRARRRRARRHPHAFTRHDPGVHGRLTLHHPAARFEGRPGTIAGAAFAVLRLRSSY